MVSSKQRLFIDEYLISLNATGAAKKAGYADPGTQGPRLTGNPKVKKEIQRVMDKRTKKLKIDADFVLRELYELYQRVMQNVKPALNSKTGKPITDGNGNALYTFNANAALKALELIGKHLVD